MKNHYFQMDDRALWSELRSGSLIALEVIYRRYYSLLLNYVHIPEHTRSLSGSLLGYKTIP